MRKITTRVIFLVLTFLCIGQINAFAVDPVFNLGSSTICEDDAVNIDVTVADFTIITSFQFTIDWDQSVLELKEVTNVNPIIVDNFLSGNFTADSDSLTVNWLDFSTVGISLDDDAVLFTLSFDGVGENSDVTLVSFTDDPTVREVSARENGGNPLPVATTWNDGMIMIAQPELMESVVQDDINMDGKGSVDITVTNGTAPYSYVWNNGANTEDLIDVTMGEYSCMVTDAKGCETPVGPFMVGNTTNTNEIEGLIEVAMFPNPTDGQLNLKVELEYIQQVDVIVYNFLGEKVYFEQLENANIEVALDLAGLTTGNYLVQLRTEDGMYVEKVQIRR